MKNSPFNFPLTQEEQELEKELTRLDAAGALKSTLTPARKKALGRAAKNTLSLLCEKKRRLVEKNLKARSFFPTSIQNHFSASARKKAILHS